MSAMKRMNKARILGAMMRSLPGTTFSLPDRSAFGVMRASALSLTMLLGSAGIAGLAVDSTAAVAQRPGVLRTVTGKVTDKGDRTLKGSVVYLKDDKTLSVKSFIADDQGGFRFGQLAQNSDYELWAELDGKKSSTRTISSFDNKNEFVMNLKIDTGK